MPSSSTENAIYRSVTAYAGVITRRAKQYAPNTHIQDAIQSHVERSAKNTYTIRVFASTPDARAYEYGSGIHAKIPKPIIMVPRNAPQIVFQGTNKWSDQVIVVPPMGGGIVKHPGVAAANAGKGYLRPAINETKDFIRKRFANEIKQGIIIDIQKSFKRGK